MLDNQADLNIQEGEFVVFESIYGPESHVEGLAQFKRSGNLKEFLAEYIGELDGFFEDKDLSEGFVDWAAEKGYIVMVNFSLACVEVSELEKALRSKLEEGRF